MADNVTSHRQLQRMTHEERRSHFAASVLTDPEHDQDPRVHALFVRARDRAQQRLAEREKAPSDGE